jgi:hypothetical protein
MGIAIAAILITTLAWLTAPGDSDRLVRLSAVESPAIDRSDEIADLRESVAATEALSEKLASLKARVDVLDASISRLYDKLLDVHVRIDTMASTSVSAPSDEATEANAVGLKPMPAGHRASNVGTISRAANPVERAAGQPAEKQAATPAAGTSADVVQGKQARSAREANAGAVADAEIKTAANEPTGSAKSREATSDAGAPAPPKAGPWVINMASFADKPSADRFAARARAKDVRVHQTQVTVKGRPYWRVQVAGFATAEEARAHADSIKRKLGLKETWISRR